MGKWSSLFVVSIRDVRQNLYDNDLDWLKLTSLLYSQLKLLHFLSLLIRRSDSQTQAF
jgi:hypothetical protein